jgi:hypothetical protein
MSVAGKSSLGFKDLPVIVWQAFLFDGNSSQVSLASLIMFVLYSIEKTIVVKG